MFPLAILGAVAGAVIGAASVAITSAVKGEKIDWKSVGSAALGGAVAGAIGGATLGAGLLVSSGGMIAAGAAGGAVEQASDNALHGRELSEGVTESAAIGAAVGGLAAGGRVLARPLSRFVRSGAAKKTLRNLAQRGRKLPGQAWQGIKRFGSAASRTVRRRARSVKVNLSLGRRRLARAAKPITEPVAKATRRYVKDPFKRYVAEPLERRVGDPLKRRVLEPTKRALAPFAARIGRTRAGQATKKLWGRYLRALDKNPVRTKALTSATIGAAGDLIAQATDDQEGIDLKRTAFVGGFGLMFGGPVGHYWFNGLERMIPGGGRALVAKVLLDQGLMNTFGTQVFFTSRGMILEGQSFGDSFSAATATTKEVLPTCWMFWIPFHSVNFSKVPLNLRKPVADAAGLVWGVVFSRLAFAEDEPAATTGTVTEGPATPTVRAAAEDDDKELEASLDGLVDSYTPR